MLSLGGICACQVVRPIAQSVALYSSRVHQPTEWKVPPYFKKGSWTLPSFISHQSETEPASASMDVKVPKNWRQRTDLPMWKRDLYARREKMQGESWTPRRKVSRTTMEDIRHLKSENPQLNSGSLGEIFGLSPEAVRRILKSRWTPSEDEEERIRQRWSRRGDRVRELLRQRAREGGESVDSKRKGKPRKVDDIGNILF